MSSPRYPTNNDYQARTKGLSKYPVGYEFKTLKGGNAYVEKIEGGIYYLRYSDFVGYICCRVSVFDANHESPVAVSQGTGMLPHPEQLLIKKMPFS